MRFRLAFAAAFAAAATSATIVAPTLSTSAVAATTPTAKASATSVTVGGSLKISGTTPVASQKVVLQLWRAQRWENSSNGTSTSTKTYSLVAPTWWQGARKVRIAAFAADGSVTYSPDVTYTVKTAYTPVGLTGQYAMLGTGIKDDTTVTRWDPCTPIGWKYNPAGQRYSTSLDDAKRAFTLLSRATGLRFTYEGTTTDPGTSSMAGINANTNIVVAWSTAAKYSSLTGGVLAVSKPFYDSGKGKYTYGRTVLDAGATGVRTGAYASGTVDWTQVMTHEFAHNLGLDHPDGASNQNLYYALNSNNHRLGAGDLNGLRLKGASTSGCIPD